MVITSMSSLLSYFKALHRFFCFVCWFLFLFFHILEAFFLSVCVKREPARSRQSPGLCEEAGSGPGRWWADQRSAGNVGQPHLLLQAGRSLCGECSHGAHNVGSGSTIWNKCCYCFISGWIELWCKQIHQIFVTTLSFQLVFDLDQSVPVFLTL